MDLTQLRDRVFRRLKNPYIDTEDIDDEMNMVQRAYIQPVARLQKSTTYTTTEDNEEVELAALAPDIYHITFITDNGREVPLLKSRDIGNYGARVYGDKLSLQGIGAGQVLAIDYEKQLKSLGLNEGEVTEPEIEEQWHDLYWLGALAMLEPERYYPVFQDRLREFKFDRNKKCRVHGGRIKHRLW